MREIHRKMQNTEWLLVFKQYYGFIHISVLDIYANEGLCKIGIKTLSLRVFEYFTRTLHRFTSNAMIV